MMGGAEQWATHLQHQWSKRSCDHPLLLDWEAIAYIGNKSLICGKGRQRAREFHKKSGETASCYLNEEDFLGRNIMCDKKTDNNLPINIQWCISRVFHNYLPTSYPLLNCVVILHHLKHAGNPEWQSRHVVVVLGLPFTEVSIYYTLKPYLLQSQINVAQLWFTNDNHMAKNNWKLI